MKKIIFTCIAILLFSCKSERVIDNIFDKIIDDLGKEKVYEFSSQEEKKAVSDLYMTYGITFRNEYLKKNSPILKYFNKKGVDDIYSICHIIFSSLHRKLNKKPLNINNQIRTFNEFKNEDLNCKKSNKYRAENYFNNYKERDTIVVRMQIRDGNNAIEKMCLGSERNNWIFSNSEDLLVTGIINHKNDSTLSFSVRVLELNKKGVKVLMRDVNKEDIIDFDLRYNVVEKKGNGTD